MNELSPRDEHAYIMRRLAAFGLMKDIVKMPVDAEDDEKEVQHKLDDILKESSRALRKPSGVVIMLTLTAA